MNLLKRLIVALIFIPILLFTFYKGSWYLFYFLSILTYAATYEYRNLMKHKNIELNFFLPIFTTILFMLSAQHGAAVFSGLILLLTIIIFFVDLIKGKIDGRIARISSSIFPMVYIAGSFSILFSISLLPKGNLILPLLIILIWVTDSFAYFIGMTLGKHRGLLEVSPKKSIEGFIAGIIFPFVTVFGLYYFKRDLLELRILLYLAISAGIFGQLGDLFESALKRDAKIKDSSQLIPGHGGILDRFDSLLVAAPAFWFFEIIIKLIWGLKQ